MSAETPTTPVAGGVDVAGDFGLSLLVLMRAYRTVVASVLYGVPQGARGYQTLAVVTRGDQQNQLALATYLGIDRTVMTYLIDDLVTAGLVERRLNPADRRQRKIVATDHGVNTFQELQRQVQEAEDRLLGALDENERQAFRTLLGRIACDVRDMDLSTAPCDVTPDPCEVTDPGS
ncbi:DNA-binding MarR family transcriptional regulator [Streptomyces sp. 3211.6]|uniref:MarR family winged helix-turn-helix transcriptional regulator n=1 Tax=Streptomyces TaxID=1883 RepID=UPI0009A4A07B|nr:MULTISPECIES: MarR family winged helix-turn-helix transcriptional regulator [Streptomyces]RKT07930.1 DNA-binding MarR family transcriptional regulator [Streptomyces sp. 3211.6]RPF44449.1 DNA-binding MarR family transcriptional regulator [Streptomyces sp. Ag109_G2-6]